MLSGTGGHGAIGRSRVLYIANRPGAVAVKTEDDLLIEAENERMAKLGYIGFRPGSVAERNRGHALFDAHGVPERAAVQRELRETRSAIITSVVTVRRGDAERLGLSTKQDWERLLRSRWQRYVESLGVMAPQDVRWVAAYHVNQENNLHCHVFTWDASGRFDSLLPKRRMARANDELRAAVARPQREELSLARTRARDDLVAEMRSCSLEPGSRDAVLAALPAEGSLKYGRLAKFCPEARDAVDGCVERAVRGRTDLTELRARYMEAAAGHARLKGLQGAAYGAHMAAAEADLRNRLGNALILNVRARRDLSSEAPPLGPCGDSTFAESPASRLGTARLCEELAACLSPAEVRDVADALRGLASGRAEALSRCAPRLEKLPSLKGGVAGVCESAAANARGVAALAAQAAVPGCGGDAGDDAALEALGLALRAARALELAERFAGKGSGCRPVLRESVVPAIGMGRS